MKRTERVGAMIKILSDSPGISFGLGYFCERFGAAKSTVSEDLSIAKKTLKENGLGRIITIPGAGGGVKYVPYMTASQAAEVQNDLCKMLRDPARIMGGGFLYTSDIMFSPGMTERMASIFAEKFKDSGADYVATIETKGIPLAFMTARLLNIPVIVVRRETKVSEGPTVSINYFSGSSGRMSKMSMAKKAVEPKSKAIIIDDFMRAGGSLKGITELLAEFEVEVCGIGVAIASAENNETKVNDYTPLVYLRSVDESSQMIDAIPNSRIF